MTDKSKKKDAGTLKIPLYAKEGNAILEYVDVPADLDIFNIEAIIFDGHIWVFDKEMKNFRDCDAWIDHGSPIAKITPLPQPRKARRNQKKISIVKSPLNVSKAEAIHTVARSLASGECPRCHYFHINGIKRTGGKYSCMSCEFYITHEEMQIAIRHFGPLMEENLAEFEAWRKETFGS